MEHADRLPAGNKRELNEGVTASDAVSAHYRITSSSVINGIDTSLISFLHPEQ